LTERLILQWADQHKAKIGIINPRLLLSLTAAQAGVDSFNQGRTGDNEIEAASWSERGLNDHAHTVVVCRNVS
jgi:hypothetical protein